MAPSYRVSETRSACSLYDGFLHRVTQFAVN